MRYWFDTEFIESGPSEPIYLLSLGMVAEDGRELYAINFDAPRQKANEWVQQNVLPLVDNPCGAGLIITGGLKTIGDSLKTFIYDPSPEFWGYYADYDWVVFCQIFGAMIDLPKGWPMYCRDLKQWCDQLGNPKLPEQKSTEHNALHDARWNREAWEFLLKKEEEDFDRALDGL